MKRLVLPVLFGVAAFGSAQESDDAAIIAVVRSGYVEGVHLDADPDKIRAGMHDAFIMFVPTDNNVTQLTRDAWIERLAKAKAEGPANAPRPDVKADIKVLDRSGNAAVVRVELTRDGKHIFTDYISLYRVNGQWKMVGKVFQRHP